MCGQRGHQRRSRSVLPPPTGKCLDRQLQTPQTTRNTQRPSLLSRGTAWMMFQSPEPSPFGPIRNLGRQGKFTGPRRLGTLNSEVCPRRARSNMLWGIIKTKKQYYRRIANHFNDSRDTWSLWHRSKPWSPFCTPAPISFLLNTLNYFFSHFEEDNNTPEKKIPPLLNEQLLLLSPSSMMRSLRNTNTRKAPGSDGPESWATVLRSSQMSSRASPTPH